MLGAATLIVVARQVTTPGCATPGGDCWLAAVAGSAVTIRPTAPAASAICLRNIVLSFLETAGCGLLALRVGRAVEQRLNSR
jgi:hypothetical protein